MAIEFLELQKEFEREILRKHEGGARGLKRLRGNCSRPLARIVRYGLTKLCPVRLPCQPRRDARHRRHHMVERGLRTVLLSVRTLKSINKGFLKPKDTEEDLDSETDEDDDDDSDVTSVTDSSSDEDTDEDSDQKMIHEEKKVNQDETRKETAAEALSLDERLRSIKLPFHISEFMQQNMESDDNNDEDYASESNHDKSDGDKSGKDDYYDHMKCDDDNDEMSQENAQSLDERLRSFKLPSHFPQFLQQDMGSDDDNDDSSETKHDNESDMEDESDVEFAAPAIKRRRRHTSG